MEDDNMTMVVLMDAIRMIRTMKEGRRVRVFDMVNMYGDQPSVSMMM